MSKKIVSFLSPNFRAGPEEYNAYYLPYTSGVLWSYVSQFDSISDNYELGEFVWRRDKIAEVSERLKDHHVICVSSYIWNNNYNQALCKELKRLNPDIFIVFGGPEPPITDPNFFIRFPYIDICVKNEGEQSLKLILENLDSKNFAEVPGILINDNGRVIDTGEALRLGSLDIVPSPYLSGIFDHLFHQHPEVRWNVTLETNRGCPYMCTFCDWGSLTYSKIRKFDIDKVYKELEWVGKMGCDYISFTDANFGIFPERDMSIAKKLVEVQKKYNNPKAYTITWAKNQKKEVVDIVRTLITEGGSNIGLMLSVQSMDERTLDIIKRKNLDTNRINEVFALCEENDIPLYTELILGLPGQTLEAWKENFYILYKAGNHTGIGIYQAQLLENAEMNLTQREKFKIEGTPVRDYIVGSSIENEVHETIEVVVSTIDLPREKMIEAQLHSWFQNTFHINGVTPFISRFLYNAYGIEYRDFYENLFAFLSKDPWFASEVERITEHYSNWTKLGAIDHPRIEGIEITGINLINSTSINISSQRKHNHLFDLIEQFIKETYDVPSTVLEDLLLFQKNYLVDHTIIKEYPKAIELRHDVYGYIQGIAEINDPATYIFEFPEDKNMNLRTFCELLYYARRRNFGKAKIAKL